MAFSTKERRLFDIKGDQGNVNELKELTAASQSIYRLLWDLFLNLMLDRSVRRFNRFILVTNNTLIIKHMNFKIA